MNKNLYITSILVSCVYFASLCTGFSTLSIANDSGNTIWVMPSRCAQKLKEESSFVLREGPRKLKISSGQMWNFTGSHFYVYENTHNDVYELAYKVMINPHNTNQQQINYSDIKNKTLNKKQFTVQDLHIKG